MDAHFRWCGVDVDVEVACEAYVCEGELNEAGKAYVQALLDKYDQAIALLKESHLEAYNAAPFMRNEPNVSSEEFRKSTGLLGVVIGEDPKSGSLRFADNGAVGGFIFEVAFDADENPVEASIVG